MVYLLFKIEMGATCSVCENPKGSEDSENTNLDPTEICAVKEILVSFRESFNCFKAENFEKKNYTYTVRGAISAGAAGAFAPAVFWKLFIWNQENGGFT